MTTFFEKLGQSPWEERINVLSGRVLKVMFVIAVLWVLLNLDTLIPILTTPTTLVL
jgi:hypothetical protein